jgi:hypothetical protein
MSNEGLNLWILILSSLIIVFLSFKIYSLKLVLIIGVKNNFLTGDLIRFYALGKSLTKLWSVILFWIKFVLSSLFILVLFLLFNVFNLLCMFYLFKNYFPFF